MLVNLEGFSERLQHSTGLADELLTDTVVYSQLRSAVGRFNDVAAKASALADTTVVHVPTFDAEVAALNKNGISLDAFWFPAALDKDARAILDLLHRHSLHSQLWVTMGDPAPAASSCFTPLSYFSGVNPSKAK